MAAHSTGDDAQVVHAEFRQLRDLSVDEPGMSFPRKVMRQLGVIDDEVGVPNGHQIQMVIFDDGRVELDLQLDTQPFAHLDD